MAVHRGGEAIQTPVPQEGLGEFVKRHWRGIGLTVSIAVIGIAATIYGNLASTPTPETPKGNDDNPGENGNGMIVPPPETPEIHPDLFTRTPTPSLDFVTPTSTLEAPTVAPTIESKPTMTADQLEGMMIDYGREAGSGYVIGGNGNLTSLKEGMHRPEIDPELPANKRGERKIIIMPDGSVFLDPSEEEARTLYPRSIMGVVYPEPTMKGDKFAFAIRGFLILKNFIKRGIVKAPVDSNGNPINLQFVWPHDESEREKVFEDDFTEAMWEGNNMPEFFQIRAYVDGNRVIAASSDDYLFTSLTPEEITKDVFKRLNVLGGVGRIDVFANQSSMTVYK